MDGGRLKNSCADAAGAPNRLPGTNSKKFCGGSDFLAWERVTSRLLKHNSWCRLGSLGVTLTSLPDDVNQLFNNLQHENGVVIDAETRFSYFKNFSRTALGAATLPIKKVEELLLRMNPGIDHSIGSAELQTLMRAKLEQNGSDSSPGMKDLFDFDQFAALLCEVIKLQRDFERAHRDKRFFSAFRELFPIEPESTPKQLWDIMCMFILLYCSFSVPLSIAFPATTTSESGISTVQDQVELSFDIIFMLDIGFSFLTAYDNQGITVREFRAIAANYLRTWFLLDFAGSFPFDVVFAEAFAGSSNFLQAMRAIRAVRLLKLVGM